MLAVILKEPGQDLKLEEGLRLEEDLRLEEQIRWILKMKSGSVLTKDLLLKTKTQTKRQKQRGLGEEQEG